MEIDSRVNLAELNFPGGPVSSRRKNEHAGRGWKKIELWIEQEEAEGGMEDDVPRLGMPRQVTVKVEDEAIGGIVIPEPMPERMVIDDEMEEGVEEKLRQTEKRRAKRRRGQLRGKTREEKEELARDEVDSKVLKDAFLNPDPSAVCASIILSLILD